MTTGSTTQGQINITPLVDVLLVLLIICMVVTPLTPRGLPASVPQPTAADAPAPAKDVLVNVRAHGLVEINGQTYSTTELPARFAQLVLRQGQGALFLRGEAELSFAEVAAVLDMARAAGFGRIGLMK